MLLDFGVGMVDGRSDRVNLASTGGIVRVLGVDKFDGVVGSIVGEGGSRTRSTDSSSNSVSVATVDMVNLKDR